MGHVGWLAPLYLACNVMPNLQAFICYLCDSFDDWEVDSQVRVMTSRFAATNSCSS